MSTEKHDQNYYADFRNKDGSTDALIEAFGNAIEAHYATHPDMYCEQVPDALIRMLEEQVVGQRNESPREFVTRVHARLRAIVVADDEELTAMIAAPLDEPAAPSGTPMLH